MEFDKLLQEYIGEIGPYQVWLLFWLSWFWIWGTFNTMGIVFLAAVPDHYCLTSALQNLSLSQDIYLNISIPHDGKKYSNCEMYDRNYTDVTDDDVQNWLQNNNSNVDAIACKQWMYDTSVYKTSLVSEWDLVCDNEWKIATVQSAYALGNLIGIVFFGQVADLIGRRPVILFTSIGVVASHVGEVLSVNYPMFLAMRVILAINSGGCFTAAFVHAIELVGPKWRTAVGILPQYMWGVGYLLLAAITYGIRDWFTLALALAGPQLLNFIFIFILPESARWLYAKEKKIQGDKVVKKIAKWNKTKLPDILNVEIKEPEHKTQATLLDLFRTPNLRLISMIQFFIWFVTSMVYYGLSLNSSNLGGDPYINFLISAGVEIPAYALFHFLLRKLGRRVCTCLTLTIGGLALLCLLPVSEEHQIVILVLSMTGKFMVSGTFAIIYLYSAELFPTPVRTVGVGCSSMFARVGAIVAPYIGQLPFLARHLHGIKYAPSIIFGAFSFAAGLLTLLLPETLGKNLPETLEEGELMSKRTSYRKVLRL